MKDLFCKDLISWLEGKYPLPKSQPPAALSNFEIEEGVLYLLRHLLDRVVKQIFVPQHLYPQALHMAHCPPSATHPGALRTYHSLCNNWYFPNMLTLSRKYVLGCMTCQRRKGSAPQAPLQCHPLPTAPLELVSADLMDLHSSDGATSH